MPLLRPRTLKSESPSLGPELTITNEGSHCLNNKTYKTSPNSALLINKSDDPMLDDNDPKISVIKSEESHGISAANTKKDPVIKTNGPANEAGRRREGRKISTEAPTKSRKDSLYQSNIKEGPHTTVPPVLNYKTTSQDKPSAAATGGDKRITNTAAPLAMPDKSRAPPKVHPPDLGSLRHRPEIIWFNWSN